MKKLLVILFLLAEVIVFSQNVAPRFERPFSTNIIPSKTIYGIAQTDNGYIYFGTDEGLVRYNGVSYELLDFDRKGKAVNGLVADGDDLFCLTFSKELILLRQDSISVYGTEDFQLQKTSRLKIMGDTLFILNKQNFQLIDKNSLDLIKGAPSASTSCVLWDIFKNEKNQTMVLQNYFSVQPISDLLKVNNPEDDPLTKLRLVEFAGRQLVYDCYNNFFYTLKDGAAYKENWRSDFLENQKVHALQNYLDEKFLISTYNGLFISDANCNLLHHMYEGVPVSNTYVDHEGNIWVSTLNDGLFIIPNLNDKTIPFEEELSKKDKFFKGDLGGTSIYLGTHQGWIFSYDLLDNKINKRKLQKDSELQTVKIEKDGLLYAYCDKLYTLDTTLSLLDSANITATKDVKSWMGALYCATSIGINKKKGKDTTKLLYGKWIRSLANSPDGNELVANTDYGFYCLDSSNNVNSFNKDALKYYSNEELFLYIKNNEIHINENGSVKKIGLDYSVISYFVEGDFLFVYNRNNIFQYDLSLLKQVNSWETGFELAEEPIVSCFAFNEELLVVSESEIQLVAIEQDEVEVPLKLNIRNIKELNKEIHIEHAGRLQLDVDVLNSVRNRGGCTLYYSLGDEWIEIPKGTTAYKTTLERLPSGKYPIYLRAVGRNNAESAVLTLHLNVQFPFWQKWWFLLLVIFTVLTVGTVILKYILARVKSKNMKEIQFKRLELQSLNSKLEALRSQMNPHFIFNTINTIQAQIMSSEKNQAYDSLNTFSKLIRSALEHSTKNFVSIREDHDFISNYLQLESIRFNHSLNYVINIDQELTNSNPQIPSLITQPFVENAIKHGLMHKSNGEKKLSITYREVAGYLEVEIIDNGVGRAKSAEINKSNQKNIHLSYSTGAISKRLAVLENLEHSKVNVTITDLVEGTSVLIKIKTS